MNELYLRYKSIAVFRKPAKLIEPLAELLACDDPLRCSELAAEVFSSVAESGCGTTGEYIKRLLQEDSNAFSRAAAMGERVSDRLKGQVRSELLTFKQLSLIKPGDFATPTTQDFFPEFGFGGFSVTYDGLLRFYAHSGCGELALSQSFLYGDRVLCPTEPCAVRLSDLKDYDEEKRELVSNTQNFIDGMPAFHTLLSGDRGTGKSTTVRALAYEFKDKLKIIEVRKSDVPHLPELIQRLDGLKQKFIIFIDGISLDPARAAAVEYALERQSRNYLLYCTFDSARNAGPAPEEQTLFDRFGLVVTYVNPDRDAFVDILKQILRSRAVKWREEYASIAELAAHKKGGRSPHAAKQIADLIECTYAEKRGG